MMVANGEAEAMMFLDSWTHKWDTCAGEAIIKALGGNFTTPLNTNIYYNPFSKDTHNKEGMIVTICQNVHDRCLGVVTGSRSESIA